MSERFTPDARAVVVGGQEHARQLGHRWIGCEHLLLALASTDGATGQALRNADITGTGPRGDRPHDRTRARGRGMRVRHP